MPSQKSLGWFNNDRLGSDFKRHAIKSGGITVLSQTIAYSIQTVGTIIMARLLAPEDFGLVAFVSLVSLLLMNFGVKFSESIIQEDNISDALISNLFWVNLAISLGLGVILICFSPILVWFFKEPRLIKISAVMALMILSPALSTQHSALLKRKMKFRAVAIIEIVASVLSVLGGIFLAINGSGYWAIVARQLIYYFAGTMGAWLFCQWRPAFYLKEPSVAKILRFTIRTYGNYCMTYLGRSLDKILVGRFFGTAVLGNYDRAYNLSSAFPNQMIAPLTGVAIATLSRLRDDPDKFCRYYEKVVSLLGFIGMGVSLELTLIGRDLIVVILGPQWEVAGSMFVALSTGLGISLIYSTTTWLHISLGRADRAFKWSVFSFAISIVFFGVGLQFGYLGIALASSATAYALAGPASRYALKPLNRKEFIFFRLVGKHVLAAFLAGIASWLAFYSSLVNTRVFINSSRPLRILFISVFSSSLYLVLEVAVHGGLQPFRNLAEVLKILMSKEQRV